MALQIDSRLYKDEKYGALTATQKLALWEIAALCPASKEELKELIGDRSVSITSLVSLGFLAENPERVFLATELLRNEKSTYRVQAYRARIREEIQAEQLLVPESIKIADKSPIADCPYQKIVDLYHQHCPTLTRVVKLTPQRQRLVKDRWRDTFDKKGGYDNAIEFFKDYFITVSNTPFLLGSGSTGWKADLEFLMRPGKFIAVIEGKYNK